MVLWEVMFIGTVNLFRGYYELIVWIYLLKCSSFYFDAFQFDSYMLKLHKTWKVSQHKSQSDKSTYITFNLFISLYIYCISHLTKQMAPKRLPQLMVSVRPLQTYVVIFIGTINFFFRGDTINLLCELVCRNVFLSISLHFNQTHILRNLKSVCKTNHKAANPR
jgi:hypothetical protein